MPVLGRPLAYSLVMFSGLRRCQPKLGSSLRLASMFVSINIDTAIPESCHRGSHVAGQ